MSDKPLISCICPTYKRPEMLANAVACFLAQDFKDCELVIYDDAGQFDSQEGDRWRLISTPRRFPTLWTKFNAAIDETKADLVALWEDDDVYLPHHLTSIADAQDGSDFYVVTSLLSTHQEPLGNAHLKKGGAIHHGSWAYTKRLWEECGRYTTEHVLNGDILLRNEFLKRVKSRHHGCYEKPSYIYRWSRGAYNGSSKGRPGFKELFARLERLPSPRVGKLIPRFDSETVRLCKKYSQ